MSYSSVSSSSAIKPVWFQH